MILVKHKGEEIGIDRDAVVSFLFQPGAAPEDDKITVATQPQNYITAHGAMARKLLAALKA